MPFVYLPGKLRDGYIRRVLTLVTSATEREFDRNEYIARGYMDAIRDQFPESSGLILMAGDEFWNCEEETCGGRPFSFEQAQAMAKKWADEIAEWRK